jgi:hypothetical protein
MKSENHSLRRTTFAVGAVALTAFFSVGTFTAAQAQQDPPPQEQTDGSESFPGGGGGGLPSLDDYSFDFISEFTGDWYYLRTDGAPTNVWDAEAVRSGYGFSYCETWGNPEFGGSTGIECHE